MESDWMLDKVIPVSVSGWVDSSHKNIRLYPLSVLVWDFKIKSPYFGTKTVCPYLSSRSLSSCSPSSTQGCVRETGICRGFELLYMCFSFSSTTAGFNTAANLSFFLFSFHCSFIPFFLSFHCSFIPFFLLFSAFLSFFPFFPSLFSSLSFLTS